MSDVHSTSQHQQHDVRRRRDPRLEGIARNRRHPEHLAVLAALGQGGEGQASWMGPNGRMRRDPHLVGVMGPNGRRRIDRSGALVGAAGPQQGRTATQRDQRRDVVVADPAGVIAVVPDLASGRLSEHDRDVFGLARRLADERADDRADDRADIDGSSLAVTALLLLPSPSATLESALQDALAEAGADRVIVLPVAPGYAPEDRLAACLAADLALTPRHWLFPDATLEGGDLGRRLAVRLGERPACGLWRVEPDDASDSGWSCLCRSGSGRQDLARPLPRVVVAAAQCAEPVTATRHEAREWPLSRTSCDHPEAPLPMQDLGAVAVDPAAIALAEAPFILAGGNGVGDWDGFHHAARVLGASEGASRVAVDEGHMPRERQVGATGTFVSARVYLAVGISGAIQHLQGIQRCEKVIAINSDGGCDMVKRADLSVIGDGDAILAELASLVEPSLVEPSLVEQRDSRQQLGVGPEAPSPTDPAEGPDMSSLLSDRIKESRHVA
ncbi:MAG: electron transfer flavoprotein subunit alpha/FixB family protein [Pseudomonadota bacterium]|nr:electron transfer flavoprotein subunit alpha/FixB family protein [Pseudomonadota bacterium]